MKPTWEKALAAIRARVTKENFDTYFAPLRFVDLSANTIELEVGDPFFRDWVQLHYKDLLEEAVGSAAGRPVELTLTVAAVRRTVTTAPQPSAEVRAAEPGDARQPQAAEPVNTFPLNPHYTFETYVVGPNNEMAGAACAAVGREPGQAFNPLFIYGGTGLGKTHLLHAVAHKILDKRPGSRIV